MAPHISVYLTLCMENTYLDRDGNCMSEKSDEAWILGSNSSIFQEKLFWTPNPITWQYPTSGLCRAYASSKRLKEFLPFSSKAGWPGKVRGKSWEWEVWFGLRREPVCNIKHKMQHVQIKIKSKAHAANDLLNLLFPFPKCSKWDILLLTFIMS